MAEAMQRKEDACAPSTLLEQSLEYLSSFVTFRKKSSCLTFIEVSSCERKGTRLVSFVPLAQLIDSEEEEEWVCLTLSFSFPIFVVDGSVVGGAPAVTCMASKVVGSFSTHASRAFHQSGVSEMVPVLSGVYKLPNSTV